MYLGSVRYGAAGVGLSLNRWTSWGHHRGRASLGSNHHLLLRLALVHLALVHLGDKPSVDMATLLGDGTRLAATMGKKVFTGIPRDFEFSSNMAT